MIEVNGMSINYEHAPANCRETLKLHIEHGIPMGSFLTCFLSNDLMGALGRADDINIRQFKEIGMFLYNDAPSGCYGSPEKVRTWAQARHSVDGE